MPDDSSLLLAASQKVLRPTLRKYAKKDIKARRELCGRGLTLKSLPISFTNYPPQDTEAPWLAFTLNGTACHAQINWGQLRRFVGFPLEGLDSMDAALLLEDKAADRLEEFEQATGLSLRVTGIATTAPKDQTAIGISLGDTTLPLALSDPAIESLKASVPHIKATLPDDIPMAVRVELGGLHITLNDFKDLQIGDAFDWSQDPEHIRLLAQDTHGAQAVWTEDGLELSTGFQRISEGEELGMTSEIDAPEAENLDDLDVRISVRAGEALMTLGDLKKLGSGSILPLSRAEGDAVDLIVNGRRIGTGQLVSVGGDRCVEIKDLFGNG